MPGNASVVEGAPKSLAGSPFELFRLQITPARLITARTVANRGAILAHHVGNAGIEKQGRAVAVVAGEIAEFVNLSALSATNGGRPGGIQLV